ncbi:MAG: hypothetical protein II567_05085 [Candidatus Riflebacteria bacterium]|nr:hypothetical protein [Candidatus Riflebacteria bacterium]
MGLFGPDCIEMMKDRTSEMKVISERMNAEYYSDIDSVKKRFNLDDEPDICNVIAGNIEGYDYCFIEYYNPPKYRRGFIRKNAEWKSKLYLRAKNDDFPDFHLTTGKTALSSAKTTISASLLFLIGSIYFLIAMLSTNTGSNFETFGTIIWSLILLGVIISCVILIYSEIKTIKQVKKQDKYAIQNKEFKEKYVILSDEDPEKIRNVFTDEVIAKILERTKVKEEYIDLDFYKSITSVKFEPDTKLSYSFCDSQLHRLLKIVRLFESRKPR